MRVVPISSALPHCGSVPVGASLHNILVQYWEPPTDMPRTTPSEKIQTRAARAQRKPHWLCLRPGQLHLGYVRRKEQAGHWTVRRYNGGGTYKVTRLPGIADDVEPADGCGVLSFAQAQDLALRPVRQTASAAMTAAQALAD